MQLCSGTSQGELVIVHGGAPSLPPAPEYVLSTALSLEAIAEKCFAGLAIRSVTEVVVSALHALEDDPQFNAGRGSSIQSDGEIRVSAAIMDGSRQTFSAVIN